MKNENSKNETMKDNIHESNIDIIDEEGQTIIMITRN
jgi:hypothetical protein